jgi:hypothetical protein
VPYSQTTLAGLTTQISVLLDDPTNKFWTVPEIQYAIWEAMFVWGAETNYWRTRGSFNTAANTAYYDLSVQLPALRSRVWTLNQLTQDIQYSLLEAANGISGTGMSGQLTVTSILNAVQRARNRFVVDTGIPYTVAALAFASPPPGGLFAFPQTAVYVHRAAWQDAASGQWTNLWRQDNYAADAAMPQWTLNPAVPYAYSESDLAPLQIQLIPAPVASGSVEMVTVNSLAIDLTNPNATFNIPDEWVHALKWSALSDLFSAESQATDPVRAQYAQMRYDQAVAMAKSARSIARLTYNNIPLQIDTLNNLDAGLHGWRNQSGPPQTAGVMFDTVALNPGSPAAGYGISVDVVQSAPLPLLPGSEIPIGSEDIGHLIDYIMHILVFKCGGREFQQTFPQYNDFMTAVASRNAANAAKIQYLKPLLGQPSKEEDERPEMYGDKKEGD